MKGALAPGPTRGFEDIVRRVFGPFVIAAAVAAVAVSACGAAAGHRGTAAPPGPRSNATASAPPAGGTGVPADRRTALIMAMPSSLGLVVTDDYMFTLYRSDNDTPSPPRSNCTGACAVRWPPVLVGAHVTFAGGDQSLLGTVTRPDGATQLTLGSWPLYRYAGDRAEGDTRGHGIDGTWFALTADGAKAKPSAAAAGS
jgi:predicted lipoprotein with Yx(FWY)xxD motif